MAHEETAKDCLLSRDDVSAAQKGRIRNFCAGHKWVQYFTKASRVIRGIHHEKAGGVDENGTKFSMEEMQVAWKK